MIQLLFLLNGQCEIYEDDDLVFESEGDDDFHDHIGKQRVGQTDASDVLQYLADAGVVEESDLGLVEIEVEVAEKDDEEEDEDETLQ